MELTGVAKTPSLYNVIYDGERIPLLLAGGDRLTLGSVGSVIRNYTVEGSSESELLRQFYQAFVTGRSSWRTWARNSRANSRTRSASR